MPLMTWYGVDWTRPLPWATIPCPACEENELAAAVARRIEDFVCMNCGLVTLIEDPVAS